MTDLHIRLARACAHGHRQMGFVNELLMGEAYVTKKSVPVKDIGLIEVTQWGDSNLEYTSWKSLKNRLTANGFIIKVDSPIATLSRRKVKMRFSI